MNFVFVSQDKARLVRPAIYEALSDEFRQVLSAKPFSWDHFFYSFDVLLERYGYGKRCPTNCGCGLPRVKHFRQRALESELSGSYKTELVLLGFLGLACFSHDMPGTHCYQDEHTGTWWTEVSNSLWMIATAARVLRRLGHTDRAVSLLKKLGEMEPTADYANHDLLHVSYFAHLANPYAVDLSREKWDSEILVDFNKWSCTCGPRR